MKSLVASLRRLSLGLALIFGAAVLLLLSDPAPRSAADKQVLKVALINFSSTVTLEEGQQGMLDGLAEEGFIEGQNIKVTRFNAETDRATALAIAKDVVSRDFDLILTISTAMLQAVANSNKETERPHVFSISTDPWGSGVGISRENPSIHPPYMAGYGSMQPVDALFRLAREAQPDLKKVGVVWNPAESNSVASTKLARRICSELGIELVEIPVDSSAGVAEAAKAVVARGVQAIWAGGDVTVAVSFDSVIAAARNGQIPVFTNMPTDVHKGALFSLGADYHEVGRVSGLLAAKILRGTSPAGIPVDNLLPEQLAVNTTALSGLEPTWTIPKPWLERADIVVDESGTRTKRGP
jgi:putative ABC transport system substrate-binding protein